MIARLASIYEEAGRSKTAHTKTADLISRRYFIQSTPDQAIPQKAQKCTDRVCGRRMNKVYVF